METIDVEVTDGALDFMDRAHADGKPFFLWWNTTRMHIWTHLKAESQGKTGLGIYPDGMVEHDGMVGYRGILAVLGGLVLFIAACSPQNPVLGEWEIDAGENRRGAILAAEASDLERLSLLADSITAEDTEIPVSYVVEEDRARVIRGDGRGEHLIEMLPDGKIRIELPIGVSAVYRRVG
jgi:hypothetical protein